MQNPNTNLLPKITTETITPIQAKKMLESNRSNRKVNQERVKSLAQQIKDGKYIMPPDAIAFDREGRLINGQHRLYACVMANIAIQSIVYRNADEKVFMITDIGMRKTGGHALSTMGYTNTTNLSGLARYVYLIETTPENNQWWTNMSAVSPGDIVSTIESFPDLQSQVRVALNLTSKKKVMRLRTSPTPIGLALHLAAQAGQYDAMEEFLTTAASGAGIEDGSPELALVRYLTRNGDMAGTNMGEQMACVLACTLKAYIAKQNGKSIQVLSWRPTDTYPRLTKNDQ